MLDNYSKDELVLIRKLFKLIKLEGDLSFYENDYSDSKEVVSTVSGCVYPKFEGLTLVCALPTKLNRVFISITDGNPKEIGKILGGIQSYHENRAALSFGDTVPIYTNQYALDNGWFAGLLMEPSILFEGFDGMFTCGEKSYDLSLVIFVSDEEHTFKVSHGFDALLDKFDEVERDLITFVKLNNSSTH